MGGAAFGYQRLDEGTLSGGSWNADLPLSNAILPRLSAVARSSDATNASTKFRRTYAAAVTLGVVALVRANLEADARWRIRTFTDATFATPVYSSDWQDAWPVQWATGVLPAGHPNAATRRLTNAQIAARRWDVVHVEADGITGRWWEVEIDDTTNSAGYIDIGFLVMAPLYVPGGDDNVGNGAELGLESASTVGEAMSGTRLVDRRAHARTFTGVFPALSLDEAVSVLREMCDTIGLDQYVYVLVDGDDVELRQRRAFLAQQEQLAPVQLVQYGQQSVPVKFVEVL